jgi:cobalamin biosynthesis Mg chelatase CobN
MPRQSPRVSSILKDAAATSKAASVDMGKKVKKRVAMKKVAAVVVKKGVSKGNKDTKVASKASKASGSVKKLERKATKSSRSDKHEEYKVDNESEDFEDTDANQVSIFIHLYRLCIILLLYLYLCYHKCKLHYLLVLYFLYL